MTTRSSFPSFRMDVAYYANFGYPRMIVMSAMAGLAAAMHHIQPGQANAPENLPFGLYAGLAACACLALCALVTRAFEQRKLSATHIGLVHAMPWNECGQTALNAFVQENVALRLVHLRWIAQAHQRQVAAEGGDTCDLEAAVFGRSLSMRYPSA